MASKAPRTRKPTKAEVKAVADRAEARARGEDVTAAPTPLDPPETKPVTTILPKRKGTKGRPTKYTPSLGKAICKMLESGMSLNGICKRPKMPHERTVRSWAADTTHPFSPSYAKAREIGYLKMADEVLDIADDGTNDYVTRTDKDGHEYEVVNHDHIARSRLRVDTRKWLLSKCLPKIYGEKVTNEITGRGGGPIEISDSNQVEQARRIAFAMGRALERSRLNVLEHDAPR